MDVSTSTSLSPWENDQAKSLFVHNSSCGLKGDNKPITFTVENGQVHIAFNDDKGRAVKISWNKVRYNGENNGMRHLLNICHAMAALAQVSLTLNERVVSLVDKMTVHEAMESVLRLQEPVLQHQVDPFFLNQSDDYLLENADDLHFMVCNDRQSIVSARLSNIESYLQRGGAMVGRI